MPSPGAKPPFPTLADRFTVVEQFSGGEGWSAAVRDAERGGTTVLKVLEPGLELHEASLLASLDHPRIPRVLETGTLPDGRAFLLREHLDGTPLQNHLPMSIDDAVELGATLLEILAYVHLRGILHLDVKPANILRHDVDGAVEYALLDFGLGSRESVAGGGGTPFFAAPERLLGLPAEARSDLFSLGAVLFCAIRESRGPLPVDRFLARFPREDFFAAVGVRPEDLPAPFDRFLPRLVARRPEGRFLDAQDALESLVGSSGRPSLALLRPDPIAIHGAALAASCRRLQPSESLRLTGEDDDVRATLAMQAVVDLGGEARIAVDEAGSSVVVRRDCEGEGNGGGNGEVVFDVPPLDLEQIGEHLTTCLGLDDVRGRNTAAHLRERGNDGIAALDRTLRSLVESGTIVPHGTRWIWPDAVSGRAVLDAPAAPPRDADSIRDAAAEGRIEQAFAAYRAMIGAKSEDRRLTAALVEGLILGGEPSRSLPFVADLPVHHARAALDLGRVADAHALLTSVADRPAAELLTTDREVALLRATIDHTRGRSQAALNRLAPIAANPRERIVLSQILIGLQRLDEARSVLDDVLRELEGTKHPFLLAAAWTSMAECQRALGDLGAAGASYRRAQDLLLGIGHVRHSATAATNIGVIAKDLGRFEEAVDCQRRARAMYEHVGDRRGIALATANHGITDLAMGDADSALRRLRSARQEFEQLGAQQYFGLVDAKIDEARGMLVTRGSLESGVPTSMGGASRDDEPVMQDRSGGIPKEVFRTFLAVNRRLAGEADLDRAMTYLVDAAVTLTGGRTGHLLVVRDDGLKQEFRCGDSSDAALAFSRSMVNRAIQQRRTQTAEDALADRELIDMPSVQNLKQRSAICAPFVSAGGHEGALYVEHPSRAGAFGDAEKEHLDILADQAAIAVDRMIREEHAARELEQSRRDLAVARRAVPSSKVTMLGKSPPIREMRKQIQKVADSELAVLIRGETGSGKELVARALHQQSPRNRGPFVAENCSAIPENLMESEFFGHVKGAFTGADGDRAGLLETASGGTLFLDEIGDMPPALQVKLLRAIQESAVRRVGGTQTVPIDIRLVSATHKDLKRSIESGEFREDLYFRLAAVEVRIPPLRERGKDILILAESFLAELNKQHRRNVALSASAKTELSDYAWPGNVRELHHVISRAFILADNNELDALDLPQAVAPAGAGDWPAIPLQEAEGRTIQAALRVTGGDKTKAAKLLGISRTAIYEKLRRMQK